MTESLFATTQLNPTEIISELQRDDLTGATAAMDPVWGRFNHLPFVRVRGLAAFWDDNPAALSEGIDDLLIAAYGLRATVMFGVVGWHHPGYPASTAVYIALEPSADQSRQKEELERLLRQTLIAIFPGILLDETKSQLGQTLFEARLMAHRGVLVGVPTRRGQPLEHSVSEGSARKTDHSRRSPVADPAPIDRVIRTMAGEQWAFLLRAEPVTAAWINSRIQTRLDQATQLASQIRFQEQSVSQEMRADRPNVQVGTTRSFSRELVHRPTQYALALLEQELERLYDSRSCGMWQVECHYCAPTAQACDRLGALLMSGVRGPVAHPVRAIPCRPGGRSLDTFVTPLISHELAGLVCLPTQETQGFRLAPYARFDTDFLAPTGPIVTLGEIIDGNRATGAQFAIATADLAKHALVAGMTGSGKTTTLLGLLLRLHQHTIPFLVIEPAKAEYRHLLGASDSAPPAGPIDALRVYTLGDETVAPLRLNPFEFEVANARHRIHVQTHIDYLKAVFNAAFILYAPMPYVLDTCLHEVYTDCGWNLTTGLNERLGQAADYERLDLYPVFPTLADLYAKIDEVVARLGYEERIEMDVSAGLRARIGSLMLGSKGSMLNCGHGVPFAELLGRPTVLELERIGNDDEKAFLIGIILTRLYEYRRVQASQGINGGFRHLLVIEEAHRLLKNVSTEIPIEGANNRGQAVETFANILSEIRSYGQGIVMAEQIPSKLAPDAIKNTNLKLIHRLVAADDRLLLAEATNMNERQSDFLSTLPPGICAAYGEGADYPYLLRADHPDTLKIVVTTSDDGLRQALAGLPAPGSEGAALLGPQHFGLTHDDLAAEVADSAEFDDSWRALLLRAVDNPDDDLRPLLEQIRRMVRAAGGSLDSATEQTVTRKLLALATERTLDRRGRLYRWPFVAQQQLQATLSTGLPALLDGRPDVYRMSLSTFSADYRRLTTRNEGPFSGCALCTLRCRLRPDIASLAALPVLRQDVSQQLGSAPSLGHVGSQLGLTLEQTIAHHLGTLVPELRRAAVLCLGAQIFNRLGFAHYVQQLLTHHILNNYAVEPPTGE